MALIVCKECNKEVSNTAKVCPNCGAKIKDRKTINKKLLIIGIILVIVVIAILVFLSILNNKKTKEITNKVYKNAKIAYNNLNNVVDDCCDMMDSVYNAWYYAIYENDSSKSVKGFALETNLNEVDVDSVLKALGYTSTYKQDLMIKSADFSTLVGLVVLVDTENNKISKIENKLNSVKDTLQTMSNKYSDYEYYPKLKEYYSKASSYYKFVSSPTGSFEQLANTVNDYENNLRTYKEDLQFVFDR